MNIIFIEQKCFNPSRPNLGHRVVLCGAPKGFMKALKAFIKPFYGPQRGVKIKI